VLTAVRQGGRSPAEQVRLVPWDDERNGSRDPDAPWPGRIPPPAPATVLPEPLPVAVYDARGRPVRITSRLALSAAPARLTIADSLPGDSLQPGLAGRPIGSADSTEITEWAGPWPVEERWWAADEGHRLARFQVCLADGRALLLALSAGRWIVEALYD
jgi:protein ImuB